MQVFLGLGSNLGDRMNNLRNAINSLRKIENIDVIQISEFYETEPYGVSEQPDFINCAIEIETSLSAFEVLKTILKVENDLGRVRLEKWGPRNIDIDLLLYENDIINSKNLVVPHPEIQKRYFVLKPLSDICPNRTHPILHLTITELLKKLEADNLISE